jgi:hypothetical protein
MQTFTAVPSSEARGTAPAATRYDRDTLSDANRVDVVADSPHDPSRIGSKDRWQCYPTPVAVLADTEVE